MIKHTLIYGSGYVTMAVASFVLVPIYTAIDAVDYGVLGLMLVLYGLMAQIYDFGVTNSVGRFFFDPPRTSETRRSCNFARPRWPSCWCSAGR